MYIPVHTYSFLFWFCKNIHLNVHIMCVFKPYNWTAGPVDQIVQHFLLSTSEILRNRTNKFQYFCYEYRTECDYTAWLWTSHWDPECSFYAHAGEVITFWKLQFPHLCIYDVTGAWRCVKVWLMMRSLLTVWKRGRLLIKVLIFLQDATESKSLHFLQ